MAVERKRHREKEREWRKKPLTTINEIAMWHQMQRKKLELRSLSGRFRLRCCTPFLFNNEKLWLSFELYCRFECRAGRASSRGERESKRRRPYSHSHWSCHEMLHYNYDVCSFYCNRQTFYEAHPVATIYPICISFLFLLSSSPLSLSLSRLKYVSLCRAEINKSSFLSTTSRLFCS